jgi:hypothetical protein
VAVDIGTLQVNLVTNTASFTGPLSKAGQQAKNEAHGIQEAFGRIDFSEARGSIALLGEDIGIHLPRHVQTFIAELPGVGIALSAAFPVLAIFTAINAVRGFIQKSDEAKQKLAEQKSAAIEAASAIARHHQEMEIDNLKLRDQLALLNQKPAQNGPRIAAEEAKKKIDELTDSLAKAVVAEQNLFKAQIDSAFMSVIGKGTGQASEIASHFYQGLQQMKGYYDDWHRYENMGDKDNAEKFKHLFEEKEQGLKNFAQESIKTLKDIQSAPAPVLENDEHGISTARPEDYAAAQALEKQRAAATELLPIVETLYGTFLQGEAQLKAAIQNGAGKQTIAVLEQAIKNYDLFKTHAEQTLNEQIAGLKSAEAAAVQSFTAQGDTMDEAKAKADAIYGPQILQARLDFYDKLGNAAVTQAEKDRLAIEAHIAQLNAVQQAQENLAQAESRFNAIQEQQHKEQMARDAEAGKQAVDLAGKKNKDLLEQFALMQSLGDKRVEEINKEIAALQKLIASGRLNGDTTIAAYARIHQLEEQRKKDLADDMIASGKLGQVMHGTMLLMIQDGQNWQKKIGDTFRQTIDQMNSSLAQFLVEGQGNWRQLAASAIESIVQIGLQYIETKAMMAILDAMGLGQKKEKNASEANSSANAAAANTLADVPFPENIGASAAVLAVGEGFAAASMAAAQGAILPDREALVHTHPEEMILPQRISNFIVSAASKASGSGGDTHIHPVFAPRITAMNAEGVDQVLTKHSDLFFKRFHREMRRRNHV